MPGIMEHIERAGIHSGDSMAVYPPQTFSQDIIDQITDATIKLSRALNYRLDERAIHHSSRQGLCH